jgi:parallel beta-helix repeat protein
MPAPARRRRSRPRYRSRYRRARLLLAALLALGFVLTLALAAVLDKVEVPPRSVARYLEYRLSDRGPLLSGAGRWLGQVLTELDRGTNPQRLALPIRIGARSDAPALATPAGVRPVTVASADAARRAVETAQPGDAITFEPGTYRFAAPSIFVTHPGTASAGIVVRAVRAGTVIIEIENAEGFVVSAPYWRFENLTMRGVCAQHSACEHAFHVVGAAHHFVARNNTLVDFNAQIKVNGQDRHFPDDGLIEDNTLSNTSPRQTENPVTPIDLVAASRWTIRGNLISDFVKAGGNLVSYGAFAKGGGTGNRFQGNVVICEDLLRGAPGSRVGLSLGGGGSEGGAGFCRDGECAIEQRDSSIESNLVASCSDDGIYVNRGANSRILDNTLIDTGGIAVRFVESGAEVQGNLVDGTIRRRDDAALHAEDNLATRAGVLYLGRHPQRDLFRDAASLDLAWTATPPRRASPTATPLDLCREDRPPQPTYGAFEDISACAGAGIEPKRRAGAQP